MSNLFLRFLGWLSLAYVAVKVVTAYYLFMFAPSGITAALEKLPALSPFDAIILLLATAAIAWAQLATWATASEEAEAGDRVGEAGAIDAHRTYLRNFAVRCREELAGHADVDFLTLYSDIDRLKTCLLGTEFERQLAPLHAQAQLCAATADNIAQADRNAMRLRDNGLTERASKLEGEALEKRMDLLRHREQALIAADVILRTTGPLG